MLDFLTCMNFVSEFISLKLMTWKSSTWNTHTVRPATRKGKVADNKKGSMRPRSQALSSPERKDLDWIWSRGTQILGGNKENKHARAFVFMKLKYFSIHTRLTKNKT